MAYIQNVKKRKKEQHSRLKAVEVSTPRGQKRGCTPMEGLGNDSKKSMGDQLDALLPLSPESGNDGAPSEQKSKSMFKKSKEKLLEFLSLKSTPNNRRRKTLLQLLSLGSSTSNGGVSGRFSMKSEISASFEVHGEQIPVSPLSLPSIV